MNINHRVATIVVTITTAAATIVAAPWANATTTAGTSKNGTVVSGDAQVTAEVAALAKSRGAGVQDALEAYWTPERMKAAQPDTQMPAVKAAAAKAADQGQGQTVTATGPQGAPERIAGTGSTVAVTPSKIDQNVAPQSYYPDLPVGHPTARTVGKVFFTLSGLDFVCSGSTVNTEGRATVWTAGHCLSGNGEFASNWCFVPNYVNGEAPFGIWCAYQLWTTVGWLYFGDFRYDVGAALMFGQFGYCIVDFLGGQGIAWNFPIGQYVFAFGYPQAPPFDGQFLVAEQGWTYDGAFFYFSTPETIFMFNEPASSCCGW
ncbi:MAG TPA: hypothetical protein VFC19_44210 [Candidatus Limnocylindrales bacterium]|nr:hypothetical protein [Candidatus Limnocylindrales bacterium]